MALNTFHIFNSCIHKTPEQLYSILKSNIDCDIQLSKGKKGLTDVEKYPHPDLYFRIKDSFSSEDQVLKNRNSSVPEINIICTEGSHKQLDIYSIENADDLIISPLIEAEVLWRISRLIGTAKKEKEIARKNILQKAGISQLIGCHPSFLEKISIIPQLADTDATVLLLGETGVGKELCARAIHYLSKRSDQPFIPVDCGAIPPKLIEGELFGHLKGAYTDAHSNQLGIIAEAKKGSLFLDEIDTLPFSAQSKLLRLLQDKTYRILGQAKRTKADIRIITASNVDLQQKMQQNLFRKDLFYRLTFSLELPSLRERSSDIPLIASYLLKNYIKELNVKPKVFSPTSFQKLLMYDWPGNIRELQNVIQQAIVLSPNYVIQPWSINIPELIEDVNFRTPSFREAKKKAIEQFEKEYITKLLIFFEGNITHAAREASKDRSDFMRLMKKFNLERKSFLRNH